MLTVNDIINAAQTVANEFNIKKISLFGSYADGSHTEKSDVDLLVEFHSEAISLLTIASVKHRIEDLLKVSVDIIHAPIDDNALIKPSKVVEIYAA